MSDVSDENMAEILEKVIEQGNPHMRPLLRFFRFQHLPEGLRETSARFAAVAVYLATGPSNAEATVALRKLLEAKDAAVRARLPEDA